MEKTKNITFEGSIGNKLAYEYGDYEVYELFPLSDGYNSHGIPITNELLRAAAPTILGQPIIGKVHNTYLNGEDFEGHEFDEFMIGYVPKDSEFRFVESTNGEFIATYCVISKYYSNGGIDILQRDKKKAVSVEMVATYKDSENDEETEIESLKILAVTVLGSRNGKEVKPSCTDAKIKEFKQDEAKFCFEQFEEYKIKMEEIKTEEEDDILKKKIKDVIVELEKEAVTEDENLETTEEIEAEETLETKEEEEESKGEEELEVPKETENKEDKEKMEALELELEALKTFKAETLAKDTLNTVTKTLQKFEKKLDKEVFTKISKEAKNVTFETLEAWKSKIYFKFAEQELAKETKDETEEEELHFEINKKDEENSTMWTRMSK